MDEEDYEEVNMRPLPGRPFSFLALGIVTLASVSSYIDDLVGLMCSHANYQIERRQVEDQMRFAIESIVAER